MSGWKPKKSPNKPAPMAAETVINLAPKEKVETGFDEGGKIRIIRVYALGGFVITDFVNFATGKLDSRAFQPSEAMGRARVLARMPHQMNFPKLIQAIIDAAHQAQRQVNDGGNPILDSKFASVGEAAEEEIKELLREVEEQRKKDPELDEEMRRVERESGRKTNPEFFKAGQDYKSNMVPAAYLGKTSTPGSSR